MPDEQQMEPSEPQPATRPAAAPPEPAEEPRTEQAAPPEPAEEPRTEQAAPPEPAEEPRTGRHVPAGVAASEPPPDEAPPDEAPPDEAPPDGSDAGSDAGADGPALDEVVRERDAHRERLLRVTAEFDNYRKRTERERREWVDQAAGDLLGDLLPVVDNLDRALAADTGDGDALRQGVEIIRRQLLDVMARRGVAPIEAVGADFDPTLHEAVAHEPGDGHRDGEVVKELRRGYTLRQRLLRPSMVMVAKA